MQTGLKTRRADQILLWVEIDQPDRSVNTFTRQMLEELNALLESIEKDQLLRGVLFFSNKKGNFIAGADIGEMKTLAGPDAAREGALFDTSVRGNGNGGHTYGRELSVQDREALLEYLKTL